MRMVAMDMFMASSAQSELFGSEGLVYMWDDHDYTGNNSGGRGPGREAALQSYHLAFPFYVTLPASTDATEGMTPEVDAKDKEADQEEEEKEEVSPYQAFTIGTMHFIVSDLRSEASGTSIYSPKQRLWLFNKIFDASS